MRTKDYITFLEELYIAATENLAAIISVYTYNQYLEDYNHEIIEKFIIDKCKEDTGYSGTMIDILDKCSEEIIRQKEETYKSNQTNFERLVNVESNVKDIKLIIQKVIAKEAKEELVEENKAVTAFRTFDQKTNELKKRIAELENNLKEQSDNTNNKMFNLLINTVAILGIFVAIAFAGFGANTIFSNITFTTDNPFVLNTFYLWLSGFLSYNLLFLLFYFLFKVIRKTSNEKDGFINQCKVFIIIDIIAFIVAILLFVFSI